MMYTLKISGDDGDITIKPENKDNLIMGVDFVVNQKDLAANDRSDQLFNSVVIKGKLNEKTQTATKDIANWSLKTDKKTIYKTVEIKISAGEEIIRNYYLKEMFCVRYQEVFDEMNGENPNKPIGQFILELKQRAGNIETIKIEDK